MLVDVHLQLCLNLPCLGRHCLLWLAVSLRQPGCFLVAAWGERPLVGDQQMLHSLTSRQHAARLGSPCLQPHLAWLVVWHPAADWDHLHGVIGDFDQLSH